MQQTRRAFLKSSAAVGLALVAPAIFGQSPTKKYRVALIGCGWYGTSDLLRLIQVAPVEVVGLCDPDKKMLAATSELVCQRQKLSKGPPTYGDYREMLRQQKADLVLIGTPDHWHA
ncbi:MAG: Gfo/Idh/MocA family oxidoreductase, partial [Verrucomicrobia bacterium]|nr:Gfo/Idh/MocA family oxidoreductase [Verrucomicrobiota bacterium]